MQTKNLYTQDWELFPNQGLGKISFGSNISQINALERILGKLTSGYNSSNQILKRMNC